MIRAIYHAGNNLIQDTGAKGAESLCTPIAQEHPCPRVAERKADGWITPPPQNPMDN